MSVRRAKKSDLEKVLEIEELTLSDPWGDSNFQAALEDIFLVFAEQEISGFLVAVCCHRDVRGAIVKLAVHPDYRRQGIATQLLKEALRILQDRGMLEVCLIVEITRKPAIALYEKFGFEITRIIHTSYEDDMSDDSFYEMKLHLSPDWTGMP
ncbi:MAG TPA: N-acetyltransferase [Desulfatiglandales bacterium]|nr:N-acetyltransferase [Desulfatiglandales bacterium]